MDTVNFKGVIYRKQGDSWVNVKTYVKPPLVISQELDRLFKSSKASTKINPTTITGARPKKHKGRDFIGLKLHDFSTDTTGTHWRQETTLKGLLTHQLSHKTGRNFESRSINYRPQLLIGEPPRFDKGNLDGFNFKKAKFNFRLNEDEARYGFYIEKSDKEMDETWEWSNFLQVIRRSETMPWLESIMREYELHFLIESWINGPKKYPHQIIVKLGSPLVRVEADKHQTISWERLAITLNSISEAVWCDVNLCTSMPKEDAIEAGAEITKPVVETFVALLPLYDVYS